MTVTLSRRGYRHVRAEIRPGGEAVLDLRAHVHDGRVSHDAGTAAVPITR